MRVLGIDPGLTATGFGVIECEGDCHRSLAYGCLRPSPRRPLSERLLLLLNDLSEVITRFRPDEVAIEQPFMANNVRSALALGQARAAALLAAARAGLRVYEYPPATVKQSVAGYGRGDKAQVKEMVRLQLGLLEPPEPDDASDALAVALCHVYQSRAARIVEAQA